MHTAARPILAAMVPLIATILIAPQVAATQDAANAAHQRTFWAQEPVQVTYPPLARAARITGDVELRVNIRHDGGVDSAEVIDGHPMLRESALSSVRKLKFYCWPECIDATTTVITYTFGIRVGDLNCGGSVRVRSWKCLNMWRCRSERTIPVPIQPTSIGVLSNRIIILADPGCIETERADSGNSRAMH